MNPAAKPKKAVSHQTTKDHLRGTERWRSLSAEIDANAPILVNQGALVLKKIGTKRYWYLRFLLPADDCGHRRHRSLYVGREGDEEMVTCVRAMLESGRAARRRIQEVTGLTKIAIALERAVRASLRNLNAGADR